MDLSLAAVALYAKWCSIHKGLNPDGSPMQCWEALDGTQKASWTAIAESAYHHTRKCLEEVQERARLSKPVSGAALADAASAPGYNAPELLAQARYTPPRADGVGTLEVRVGEQAAATRPACTCKLADDAGRPRDLPTNPGQLPAKTPVPDKFAQLHEYKLRVRPSVGTVELDIAMIGDHAAAPKVGDAVRLAHADLGDVYGIVESIERDNTAL